MRADLEHLPRPGGTALIAFARRDRGFAFHWHYHPEYELTLIDEGRGRRWVGDHAGDYAAPDLVLVGPRLPHTWQAPRARAAAAVVAQFATLPGLEAPEFAPVRALLARAARGLAFSRAATADARPALRALPDLPPARRLAALYDVLARLAGDRAARPLSSPGFAPALDHVAGRRIDAVCRWLGAHARDATQPAAARVAGLTPSAFSRFFRRATGRTFAAWLQELRLGRACELLATSDRPIGEIAAQAGFRSLTNFNRCFRRRRGATPRAWRRQFAG